MWMGVDQLQSCTPIIQVKDLHEHQQYAVAVDPETGLRKKLDPEAPAIPCGLIARSIFNDTYKLFKRGEDGQDDVQIPINEKGIAWGTDVSMNYKNIETMPGDGREIDWREYQWYDMTDEHFIVWMRVASSANFNKLWGRVEQDLEPGQYYIEVQNNFDTSEFEGEKSI